MDAVLPQTDTIKKTVVSLNHVKANKLTMTKFQYLSNMSQPIEVRYQLKIKPLKCLY